MEQNVLHHPHRSDQPVFKISLCAGTNAIRKPVISPEPAWEKEVRRMQGVTGLTVIGSHAQNACSIKEGVPGTEVSLRSTNCGISAPAGTVLIVNQSVTASTASASTSFPLLPFLEW